VPDCFARLDEPLSFSGYRIAAHQRHQPAGFRMQIQFNNTDGMLLADQLRTLDRARLIKRLGTLDNVTVEAALAVLRDMFAP
jgi:mRNA-degrading endonuclease toxin of MazEF toxin-antitoxin module